MGNYELTEAAPGRHQRHSSLGDTARSENGPSWLLDRAPLVARFIEVY